MVFDSNFTLTNRNRICWRPTEHWGDRLYDLSDAIHIIKSGPNDLEDSSSSSFLSSSDNSSPDKSSEISDGLLVIVDNFQAGTTLDSKRRSAPQRRATRTIPRSALDVVDNQSDEDWCPSPQRKKKRKSAETSSSEEEEEENPEPLVKKKNCKK